MNEGMQPVPTLRPQTLDVHLNWPEAPPSQTVGAKWEEANKFQREIAKWIVGGVLATTAGLFAGSTLTRLGSLDLVHTPYRLALAGIGAVVGFAALGWFLTRSMAVLTVEVASIYNLIDQSSEWKSIAKTVNEVFKFDLGTVVTEVGQGSKQRKVEDLIASLIDKSISNEDNAVLHKIDAARPFLFVQHRYKSLLEILPLSGIMAILGFGLFAWAANPPEKPPKPETGITLKITN